MKIQTIVFKNEEFIKVKPGLVGLIVKDVIGKNTNIDWVNIFDFPISIIEDPDDKFVIAIKDLDNSFYINSSLLLAEN